MTDMNKINFEALESVTGGKDVQVKNPSLGWNNRQKGDQGRLHMV